MVPLEARILDRHDLENVSKALGISKTGIGHDPAKGPTYRRYLERYHHLL